ncbi:hypothetical protein QN410_14120, partial [Pseudomonas sp. Bout1]|uniref:hypothetical protein n=1 Tax=Pseudomonas sp. Bout1 TaxID=3048600 RepID=UPI002B236A88
MKQKKGLNNKKRISNDPNIYIRRHGETLGNVGHRILTQLKALSDARLTTNIVNLSRSKLLPKICKPLYNKDTHYQILSTKNFVNSNHYVYWALGLFFNCAKELKIFNTARIEFNLSLLSSDLPRANAALNTVESVSHCWWAISNRIHVIKELDKAPTKEIINRIQDNFPNHDVSSKIRDILLMSESNNISVFASILEAQLKEYRASGLKGIISYGAVLSCMQLPIAFDKNRKVSLEDLNNYRMESIVDQYLLFKTILSEIYVRGESLDPTIEKLSLELAEILQDEELFNLLNKNHDVDVATMAIVDDYTRGNYNSVIEAVSKAISGGLELTFGLIEIYARAKVYVGSTTDKHLYDHIANSLSSIFMLQPNSDECIAYLRKLCVKFRSEVWAKSLMFHLTHILSEVEEDQVIELSRRATLALGRWNTPKAFTSIQKRALFTDVEISRIPSERAIRHGYEDSEKLHLTPSHFPILADYLKVQSARYIQKQDWMSLINFSIDSYFKNRFASYYLPMATICGEIADLDKPDNATFISCLITLDIYNREQNGAYEELKTELFIDLLGAKKTHKPTILFPGETLEENEKYFLRYICVPFQLDNIGAFKNNDQVIHERVAILDRLILASPEIAEALKIEKDKVLETLFSDKLRAKIETGKLFVDIQALETHRKHYYKKLFDQAKSIEGGTALAPLNLKDFDKSSTDILEIESGDTGLPLAVSSNEKTSLLYKIFTAAARDFALNENYGLDKYLSAEIRHTVFVTQLRACFEKAKLITVEKNGKYLP